MTKLITAGEKYTDIDALACAFAYDELLKLKGEASEVVLPGVLNHSVTEHVRILLPEITRLRPLGEGDSIVLVDVSDPNEIAHFATAEKVSEVFDHHSGFEDFWKEKIGSQSHIEMIGACATLIWEEWKKSKFENMISSTSAKLLAYAIVSNTLNFSVDITSDRDIFAFREILQFANVPKDWIKEYFEAQEKTLYSNVVETIKNDTKVFTFSFLDAPLTFGQLELWDGSSFLKNNLEAIEKALSSFGTQYQMMSIPSISEGKNYIYTKDEKIQKYLEQILGITFRDNSAQTTSLLLRKQILKKLQEL